MIEHFTLMFFLKTKKQKIVPAGGKHKQMTIRLRIHMWNLEEACFWRLNVRMDLTITEKVNDPPGLIN